MLAFFKNLHINLNVAIERRENFDAMIERDAISVQDIDFFEKIANDSTTNFGDAKGDEKDEKIIDRDDETDEVEDEITNSTDC